MYTPPAFAESDHPTLHALIAEHGFGMLVTVRDGAPVISHLPFLLDATAGPHGTLFAHVARGNPQWRDLDGAAEAVAVFSGPHGYVSPRWYQPGNAVPTWNYAVVHAWGVPQLVTDAGAVRRQQEALTAAYEGDAWTFDGQPPDFIEGMLRGIVAFAMPIVRLEGKFKLSQNRPVADRGGVIEGLRATGMPGDALLADLMASRAR